MFLVDTILHSKVDGINMPQQDAYNVNADLQGKQRPGSRNSSGFTGNFLLRRHDDGA